MTNPTRTRAAMSALCMSAILALLGGCGSGSTKTVSAANAPTPTAGATTATRPTTGATTASTETSTTGGAPAPTTTRTATAPAFTEHEHGAGAGAEGLPAAMAVVRAHGYSPSDPSQYHPNQTLRVLVGTGSHSNDGHDKQAFFFLDGRYLGTDAARPSAQIGVVSQSDTEVTLAYALYRSSDPLCCPSGGQARVRFQLNNGRLVPLDPIPPVASNTGTSRQ